MMFILKLDIHTQSLPTKQKNILSPLHANQIIKQCSNHLGEIHVLPFVLIIWSNLEKRKPQNIIKCKKKKMMIVGL